MRKVLIHFEYDRIGYFYVIVLLGLTLGCMPEEALTPEVRDGLINPGRVLKDAELGSDDSEEADEQHPQINAFEVSEREWISRSQLPWSFAEVHYLQGRRIGYSLMTATKSELADFNLLKIERLDVIDRAPSGAVIPVRQVRYESFEKPNGELASFKFLSSIDGEVDLEIEGRVIFDQLDLTRREKSGRARRQQVPWLKGSWGPLGIQFILMRDPMSPGDIGEARVYLPQLAQFVPVRLEAKSREITALPGQPAAELLAIDVLMGTAESGSYSRVWIDQQGIIQKTSSLSGESVIKTRVEEGTVRRLADQSEFRRYREHHVPVLGSIENLLNQPRIVIEARSIELDPFGLFLSSHRQRVRSISAGNCQITLSSKVLDESSVQEDEVPSEYELSSSPMIPSNNPLFTQMSAELLPDQESQSATEIGKLLANKLHQSWQAVPQGSEIRSTLVAARTNSGGFIESASVLAALLRNRQIPARLVGGLLIDTESSQASFHVWTQAWTGQGWMDLDAFTGLPVGNRYLAMVTTDASGENPYHLWLPILKAIREISDLDIQTPLSDAN